MSAGPPRGPLPDCAFCPRLVDLRDLNRRRFGGWHNAPVPSFGGLDARLLIVGLAPGLKGANRTGRPFTGDAAGELLYRTLIQQGFAAGTYAARNDDGLKLKGCRITNAVRCVPPDNRPLAAEIAACRPFLAAEIRALPRLAAILALGAIAHTSVLAALGLGRPAFPFAHGAWHALGEGRVLADSYHCSRYNLNTGRLTETMFEDVLANLARHLAR